MNKQIFNFIWPVIKPYKVWLFCIVIAPIFSGFYQVIFNYSTKLLIETVQTHKYITFDLGFKPCSFLIFGLSLLYIVWRIAGFARIKTRPFISRDMMMKIYRHILSHDYQYFVNLNSGSITSKAKGIIDGWWGLWGFAEYRILFPSFGIVISTSSLLLINFRLFLVVLLYTVIIIPLTYFLYGIVGRLNEIDKQNFHKIIGLIGDRITNIFNVLCFAKKQHEINNLENFYNTYSVISCKNAYKQNFINNIIIVGIYCIFSFLIFITLIFLYNKNLVAVSDIAFTMMTTYNTFDNIWFLIHNMEDFVKTLSDFKASFSIILDPIEKQDNPNAVDIKITEGEIVFKNVNAGYDGKNVISNLNLTIKPKQSIGLIGVSGAGKSTLINVLMRYFALRGGEILIDNQSISDATQDSLRRQIALIPQDSMLFHMSIGENIGYAKENATQTEIEAAAKIANIHEFIDNLPEKYNTIVGERGVKLSGGQRQRIAIARAVIKKSPILILDEATSSLDSFTEQEIQKSINEMLDKHTATVIAIAHRLSTIKHLDRIIVIENGKIIEDGSFAELIIKNGKFKELWDHQSNNIIK